MAGKERKGDNQKLKMLYLAKIFSEETDDQHALTMPQIIEKLSALPLCLCPIPARWFDQMKVQMRPTRVDIRISDPDVLYGENRLDMKNWAILGLGWGDR